MGSISASGIGCAARTGGSAISTRRLAAIALLATTLGGAAAPGGVDVSVGGLRSSKGTLRICLTRDPANFPRCTDDRNAVRRNILAANPRTHFEGLATGGWALALIHDENDNRKLDTVAGIPREGVAFSRNPMLGFGPPRFQSASFAVASGEAMQKMKMRYFF